MIIDFHTHIFPQKIIEQRDEYCRRDPCFSCLYSDLRAKMVTAEDLIREMDRYQIDKAIVLNIGWVTNEICVETNDYIMESQSRYPQRIIGFCTIQPNDGDKAIKELERCINNGIKGIGEMRPDLQDFHLIDNILFNYLVEEIILKNDIIFLLHSSEPLGHEYNGKGEVTPDVIYPFIIKYPELKIVCAHMGGGLPFYGLMPEVKTALSNVYFDTAAIPFLYKPEIIKHVSQIIGVDKILFGSDYPLLSPDRVVSSIESSTISNTEQVKILGENASALLKLC